MNENLYVVLYLFMEVCSSMAVYRYVLRVDERKWQKRQYLGLLFLLLAELAAIFLKAEIDKFVLLTLFVLTYCWTKLSLIQSILLCPLVYTCTAIINVFGSYYIAWLRGCYQSELVYSHEWTLISECTCVLVCFVYYALSRKKIASTSFKIDLKKYVLLWIGVLGCGFLIAAAQLQERGGTLQKAQSQVTGTLGSGFGVVFLLICIWQIYTNNNNEQLEWENELYERNMRMQERYIEMLIDADKNMRKFRHDFHAHALAIRGHAQEESDQWLLSYVNEMIDASGAESSCRYTKIAAVDAIVQEMIGAAEKEAIVVTWKGTLGNCGEIRIFDLCTIISNLFINAIEACRLVEGERAIDVEMYRYDRSVYMKMTNSIKEETDSSKAHQLKTRKKDKKNHGLGLENVKKAVEKYQGTLTYEFQESLCTVEVLLLEPTE